MAVPSRTRRSITSRTCRGAAPRPAAFAGPTVRGSHAPRSDCKRVDSETKAAGDALFSGAGPTLASAKQYLPSLVTPFAKAIDDLRALDGPSADEAKVKAFTDQAGKGVASLKKALAAARAGDE